MVEQKDIKIDEIIRSKRKTVMMQITKDAQLVVRAPKYTPNFAIKIAVQKHRAWIEKKLKMMRERAERSKKKQFMDDEEFLYLGQTYKLCYLSKDCFIEKRRQDQSKQGRVLLKQYQGRALIFEDKTFFLPVGVSDPKKEFRNWYKKRAREVIVSRVKELAEEHGFLYNNIRITSACTRWGSCSSIGNLNFSWRLVMAPEEVIDYVIIHELAHLKERNHSRRFWMLVENRCSRYKEYKKWLSDNGCMLDL